jgi:hypothetical protein
MSSAAHLGHCTLKIDGTIAKIQIVKPTGYVEEQSRSWIQS